NIAGGILSPLLLGAFFVWSLKDVNYGMSKMAAGGRSPFYGIWKIDEFSVENQESPGTTRWQRVNFQRPEFVVVQLADEKRQFFRFQLNESTNSFELFTGRQTDAQRSNFTYERPEPDLLKINGSLSGKPLRATLRRTKSEFFLTTRGF